MRSYEGDRKLAAKDITEGALDRRRRSLIEREGAEERLSEKGKTKGIKKQEGWRLREITAGIAEKNQKERRL